MRINWYLFPLALLFRLVVYSRNKLFDLKILKSKSFNLPIISVGNISVGGTGKTPHIEYLIDLLKADYNLATLSRGYKRKTKGFVVADSKSKVSSIGDEPLQLKTKFPDIIVSVDEKRVNGVQRLLTLKRSPQVILLDDAYQHRYIKPGLNILLIDYNRLITKDYMLPMGRLREPAYNRSRANMILVTKCPHDLKPLAYRLLLNELELFPYQTLYFTGFKYQKLLPVFAKFIVKTNDSFNNYTALVVTGIANPKPLYNELQNRGMRLEKILFPDHHAFTNSDVLKIVKQYEDIKTDKKIIVCTEKDAIRFKDIEDKKHILKLPIYYLPIKVAFLNDGADDFQQNIQKYIAKHIEA